MIYFIPDDVIINIDGSKKKREPTSKKSIISKCSQINKIKKEKEKEKEKKKIHKKSKKRCNFIGCKKKLKLTDMECGCGFIFCSKHRLPEKHDCLQDLKEKSREKYCETVILGGGQIKKIEKI
tara:strand:- start:2729 stop:3097 length:369 start_codon:yes stop_codon:yes gene_type:complete